MSISHDAHRLGGGKYFILYNAGERKNIANSGTNFTITIFPCIFHTLLTHFSSENSGFSKGKKNFRLEIYLDDLFSSAVKIIEIEDNTWNGIGKDLCVVLYKYVRYVSGGRFIRMLFSLWYTISWKNISLSLPLCAPVLLSIPRRVCRARVSRFEAARGEKLHRRITGGKSPRGGDRNRIKIYHLTRGNVRCATVLLWEISLEKGFQSFWKCLDKFRTFETLSLFIARD